VIQRRKRKYCAIIVFHSVCLKIIKVLLRKSTEINPGYSKSPNLDLYTPSNNQKHQLMRQMLVLFIAICTIAACKGKKDKITVKDDSGGKATIDVSKMEDAANKMKDRSEELQKLTPLSLDELKALLPEEIMGVKRDNMEATKMAGLANFSKAEYRMNDSTEVELNVFDCAGTAGAGYYNMAFIGMMSFEKDNEDEYTRTTDFNGDKAVETCQKKQNRCELTFFGKDRYMVQLKGENVGMDELKKIANSLTLK